MIHVMRMLQQSVYVSGNDDVTDCDVGNETRQTSIGKLLNNVLLL